MKFFDRFFDRFFGKDRDIARRRQAAHKEWALLMSRGLIQEVLLLPVELGGDAREPRNMTYLPPDAFSEKQVFDAKVREAIAAGDEVKYEAVPEYEGDSFVPVRLRLSAIGKDLQLNTTISVTRDWGGKAADHKARTEAASGLPPAGDKLK